MHEKVTKRVNEKLTQNNSNDRASLKIDSRLAGNELTGDATASGIPSRRRMLQSLAVCGIGSVAFQRSLAAAAQEAGEVTAAMIAQAEWIADIELSEEQREEVARNLAEQLRDGRRLLARPVDADTVPATVFRPDAFFGSSEGEGGAVKLQVSKLDAPKLAGGKDDDEFLAFASIAQQAALLQSGQLTSERLTRIYLGRLQQADPRLELVVTLLADEAVAAAKQSDARRRKGVSRGILDGIPWAAKDLIAVPPHKTTWGAAPFKDQVRQSEATVAKRLKEAGAVLLAKVSLGALAWGDVWYGGKTRNPWDPRQGSSGSSAGSAAAVAAGLASFAIGSETLGSIVSPTRRCRTCGLRPTFGRVSRFGCMPLAWSMDKIGPIARHADDLAIVLAEIMGSDGKDPTLVDRGFEWNVVANQPAGLPTGFRIGVTKDRKRKIDEQAIEMLVNAGAEVVELELPSEIPYRSMSFILGAEASTVFEDAFREDPSANYGLWPSTFREAQFIPAIRYLRANRMRGELIRETEAVFSKVDVVVAANDLLLTNLTGHPSMVVACGSDDAVEPVRPGVVTLTSAAYREAALLTAGKFLQAKMPPDPARPLPENLLPDESAEKDADPAGNSDA